MLRGRAAAEEAAEAALAEQPVGQGTTQLPGLQRLPIVDYRDSDYDSDCDSRLDSQPDCDLVVPSAVGFSELLIAAPLLFPLSLSLSRPKSLNAAHVIFLFAASASPLPSLALLANGVAGISARE